MPISLKIMSISNPVIEAFTLQITQNETSIQDLLITTSVLCLSNTFVPKKKDFEENQMVKDPNQLNAYG